MERPYGKIPDSILDRVMSLIKHNKTSPEEIAIVNIQVRLAALNSEKSRG